MTTRPEKSPGSASAGHPSEEPQAEQLRPKLSLAPIHRQEAKKLYCELLQVESGRRQENLARAEVSAEVRAEVLRLLKATQDDSFLEPATQRVKFSANENLELDPLVGMQIEGFRLVRRLGIGAMGVVYEAQQEQPKRQVAVKLLRNALANSTQVQRFLHESEILARMHHPGVVQVYASGVWQSGIGELPWFAMELLPGDRLDQTNWSEEDVSTKLQVLIQLLDAVQHAHERGIVHRDLKPGNILLLRRDRHSEIPPTVKVLDFGVARLLEIESEEEGRTATGDMIGSLRYMSPEQLNGHSERVDERTDIYSMGVIGFELLAGDLPFPTKGLTLAEQIRTRQEESVSLGKLMPAFKGDLEAIFSRALEVEPDRRYASARDFSLDLQRYIEHRPVRARKATLFRRSVKYLRRNYIAAIGVVATFTALALGLAMYATEAQKYRLAAENAEYEAEKTAALNSFLTNDFLTTLLLIRAREGSPAVQTERLVEEAVSTIDERFQASPEVLAAIKNEVGTLYYNLRNFSKAIEYFQAARMLWSETLGEEHVDALKAQGNLGLTYLASGDLDSAEVTLKQNLRSRLRQLGDQHPEVCATMNNLAQVYIKNERYNEATSLLREAIEGTDHVENLRASVTYRANLANLLAKQGNPEAGLELRSDDFRKCQESFGRYHPFALSVGFEFANALYRAKQYTRATSILRDVWAMQVESASVDDPAAVLSLRLLARCLAKSGSQTEAVTMLESNIQQLREHEAAADVIQSLAKELERIRS